jgi:hypothetical protein
MSRIASTTRHPLALAGMLLTATLAVPAAAHAQGISAEQMLLNRTAPTISRYQGFVVPLGAATPAEAADRIDGALAMGGNRAGTSIQLPARANDAVARPQAIDGEQALLGRERAPGRRTRAQAPTTPWPSTFALSMSYEGIGAEGVDLLWRGTITAPLAGQATVRLAHAGSPEDRGIPVWPVTALLFFSADDYRSSFIAELSGTMDWTKGEMLLTGLVTDGPATGAEVEQLLRLGASTWKGSLMLRFRSRNTKSVAAITAKDRNGVGPVELGREGGE